MDRNWNSFIPIDAASSIRGCLGKARDKNNKSVEGVADLMAATHHDLYKWQANGRMPAILIPAFEYACGASFLSEWLALKSGRLVINVPLGRNANAQDVNKLQSLLTDAVSQILKFADGQTDATTAVAAIHAGMAGLAWHKVNIEKHSQPELALGDEE
ncbi:MAG: hypothetical protein NT086_19275 [Proteobacteria bacterium]|jgi:hypothetical protein|nr:hypothetical protein [Pseudomonadota bacterium]